MTEEQWNLCTDPAVMLEWVRPSAGGGPARISNRKLRLFACSCGRAVWALMPDRRSCQAIEIAEQYADRLASADELDSARDAAIDVSRASRTDARSSSGNSPLKTVRRLQATAHASVAAKAAVKPSAFAAARAATIAAVYAASSEAASQAAWDGASTEAIEAARVSALVAATARQVALLRDIVGNPFRPVSVADIYLTPTVVSLAHAAYDERLMPGGELDHDRLAVLSDALEESGCEETAILDHLRSRGSHVRGYWAIDALLRRK